MTRYAAYGTCIDSELAFDALRESACRDPKWHIRIARTLEPALDPVVLGEEVIYGSVRARLIVHRHGHRITVDDTGTFDLSLDGRVITWEERPSAWPDFVQAHCLGRVIATSLFLQGWLPLHGSAVEAATGAVAFLAPKGFGKSTLALALTAAGARLLTDDMLPVEIDDPAPRAWPGVHSVRVRADSLDELGIDHPSGVTREGKLVVGELPPARLAVGPVPLAAIYLIDPATADGVAVARAPLSGAVAAGAVVAHVKVGRMLGVSGAATMLARAAAIVGRVPTFRLTMARDLSRLPDVAGAILGWHGTPA